MKKQIISVLFALLCAGCIVVGCGSDKETSKNKPTKESEVESSEKEDEKEDEEETEEKEDSEKEESEEKKDSETEEETEEETEGETEEETEEGTEEETEDGAATVSGKYIDFDNMQFSVNGKVYTLGKTTLQEMIDDGVPFEEDDLANAQNNLNNNTQSQGFSIELGEYWSAMVYVLNDSGDNKVAAECYINEVYLPLHDDETQDILKFAFPQNISMDELKAKAGEPDDSRHYDDDESDYYSDTLEYTKESTKFYRDSSYTFEYMNGELRYITIEYMP